MAAGEPTDMTINRRFLLVRRPDGAPAAEDFQLDPQPLPELVEGQFLIRNQYASLDPAIRGWLDDKPSYMPPIALGDPVRASTIGVVGGPRHPHIAVGQWVMGLNGIEEYSVGSAGGFTQPIDPAAVPAVTNYLSLFGAVGLTAYFGFIDVCEPKAGDTVLVSGAAGAVGSLVGQIAKIKGCRAIGIAGGAAKCARLTERYGFDAAIDYRGKDVAALDAAIRAVAPEGVDIIFENVGGDILDAGLLNLRQGARVGLCGLISEYNAPAPVGIRNLWRLIVNRASIRGLLVADYVPRFAEGAAAMGQWLREGRLVFDEHIDEGIENALPAFMRLFDGSNDGKMILKLATDEQGL
jgi:NADPH-dependent curcumin reductase CurA